MVAHNLRHLHYKYHSSKSLKSSRLVHVFKFNSNNTHQVLAAICSQRWTLSCMRKSSLMSQRATVATVNQFQ